MKNCRCREFCVSTVLGAILLLFFMSSIAYADVPLEEEFFPSIYFRHYLKQFDTNKDSVLSDEELWQITDIGLYNVQVGNLEGIEYLPNVRTIGCYNAGLTSLDVSHNQALTALYCDGNNLGVIDVTNNQRLQVLYCGNTGIDTLDISQNTYLQVLACGNNRLTELDVSNNHALTQLYCYQNRLTSLDLHNNSQLQALACGGNRLAVIDLCDNPALVNLECCGNRITQLDLSSNPLLVSLHCYGNQITQLDISNNPLLADLMCSGNRIVTLDISNSEELCFLMENYERVQQDFVLHHDIAYHLYCDTWGDWQNELSVDRFVTVYGNGIVSNATEHQHQLCGHEAVEPTYNTEGRKAYWSCSICNRLFSDADGRNVISVPIAIPALGTLSVIYLPSNTETIEREAFMNNACQAVIINEGCTTIGENAFSGCSNLLFVKIPSTVDNYPENAFDDCNADLEIIWVK